MNLERENQYFEHEQLDSAPQGAGSGEPAAPACPNCQRDLDLVAKTVERIKYLEEVERKFEAHVCPPPSSQVIGEEGEPSGTASLRGAARLEPGAWISLEAMKRMEWQFTSNGGYREEYTCPCCEVSRQPNDPEQGIHENGCELAAAIQSAETAQPSRSEAEGPSPSSPPSPAPTPKDDLEAMFQAGFYADARALYEDALEAARAALPAPASQGAEAGEVNREFENMVLRERREFKERAIAAEAKVETLEADLRKSYEGKVNFDRLRQDLARASGLDCYAHTWDAHIEAIVAMRQAATPASPEALAALQAVERAPEAPALEGLRAAAQRVSDAFYADGTSESMRPSMEALTEILDAAPSAPLRDAKRVEEAQTRIAAILSWQADKRFHPLTCGNGSLHPILRPYVALDGRVGLVCVQCGRTQDTIPAAVLEAYKAESSPPLPEGEGSSPESSPVPPAGQAVDLEAIEACIDFAGNVQGNDDSMVRVARAALARLRSPGGAAHG